jgi:large subunit ribosomal protein L4
VALGPKPRSYVQRTPKKMKRLALHSALSDRAAEGKVIVVEDWDFAAPRTKDGVACLQALGVEGRALVVVPAEATAAQLTFRNLPEVHVLTPGELNTYDVLVSDVVVFSSDTLPTAAPVASAEPEAKAAPAPAAEPAPEPEIAADAADATEEADS